MGARGAYKKMVKTKAVGKCKGGLHWTEALKTKKEANKKVRKMA